MGAGEGGRGVEAGALYGLGDWRVSWSGGWMIWVVLGGGGGGAGRLWWEMGELGSGFPCGCGSSRTLLFLVCPLHRNFFGLEILSCCSLFFLPSASIFLWKTEGILAATVCILLSFYGVLSICLVNFFCLACLYVYWSW